MEKTGVKRADGGRKAVSFRDVDWKDVAIRAAKTFVQTAAAVIITGLDGVKLFEAQEGFFAALALSGAAAGVCAVWNGMIAPALAGMLDKSI